MRVGLYWPYFKSSRLLFRLWASCPLAYERRPISGCQVSGRQVIFDQSINRLRLEGPKRNWLRLKCRKEKCFFFFPLSLASPHPQLETLLTGYPSTHTCVIVSWWDADKLGGRKKSTICYWKSIFARGSWQHGGGLKLWRWRRGLVAGLKLSLSNNHCKSLKTYLTRAMKLTYFYVEYLRGVNL